MSFAKTKPSWCPTAVATNRGWVNPATNEVLVAIGGLDAKLAAEQPQKVVMETKPEPKVKPKQKKQVAEQVVAEVKPTQQLIGEVVEYALDAPVIGE